MYIKKKNTGRFY